MEACNWHYENNINIDIVNDETDQVIGPLVYILNVSEIDWTIKQAHALKWPVWF